MEEKELKQALKRSQLKPTAPSLLFLSQVKPLILLFSFQGRKGHSLSVINNGSELVACGGRDTTTDCISWRSGQDEWTHYATLRSYKDITLPFISILFFSQERYEHAAVVIRDQIILVGGYGSRFTGEILKGEFAHIGKSLKFLLKFVLQIMINYRRDGALQPSKWWRWNLCSCLQSE